MIFEKKLIIKQNDVHVKRLNHDYLSVQYQTFLEIVFKQHQMKET